MNDVHVKGIGSIYSNRSKESNNNVTNTMTTSEEFSSLELQRNVVLKREDLKRKSVVSQLANNIIILRMHKT